MPASDSVSHSSLVLNVRNHILDQLHTLSPGDRVPLEAQLAQECEVSRTTIRRSLQVLEDDGIITRRDSRRVLARKIRESDQASQPTTALPKDQEVARWLLTQIGQGKIRPGQKLSERGIAQQLGCSYAPVREALLTLSPLGLFQKSNRRQWQAVSLRPDQVREVCEMRQLVEQYGLSKLMQPQTFKVFQPKLRELRKTTEKLLQADDLDMSQFLKVDIQFHQHLLEATGNKLIVERHQFIYALIEFQLRNTRFTQDRAQLGLSQHLKILDAILRNSPSQALAHLQNHLESSEETLLRLSTGR